MSALLVLVVLALNLSGGVMVRAAGYNWANFSDNANLFKQAGKNDIAAAAQQSGLRVYIVTTNQNFSSSNAWHSWVTNQARQEGDRGAVTIGFLDARGKHNIYAVTGRDTGLTARQAGQGVDSARATFKSSGVTAGVIQTIHNYQSYGASSPGGSSAPASSGTGQGTGSAAPAASSSQGFGVGWLIPVIIVLAIVFVAFRLLRPRRPVVAPYNPNNPNLSGSPYGNPNNQVGPGGNINQPGGYGNQVGPGGYVNQPGGYVGPNYGNNRGGGFGSGLAGGLAGGVVGGVVGSAIGNELFDHDHDRDGNGNGNDGNNAGGGSYGADPNATNPGVTDTQNAQDAQGSWDTSGGGSWGGDSGGGGGDSGGSWGGDSGGGGGDGGGGGGDGGSW